MASEEQKAINRGVFLSRHKARNYRRSSSDEISQMRCTSCGERPHIELTDHEEKNGHKCVMVACGCKGKFVWFELVGERGMS